MPMNTIITGGLGRGQQLLTRGYGASVWVRCRRVVVLAVRLARTWLMEAPWRQRSA